jgi:hypothetical protein
VESERECHGLHNSAGVPDARQADEPYAVCEGGSHVPSNRKRETRLAAPADAYQRHHPAAVRSQQLGESRDIASPPYQRNTGL